MKYGTKYLSSSYGAVKKPSIVSVMVDYTSNWIKEAISTVDNWTRN